MKDWTIKENRKFKQTEELTWPNFIAIRRGKKEKERRKKVARKGRAKVERRLVSLEKAGSCSENGEQNSLLPVTRDPSFYPRKTRSTLRATVLIGDSLPNGVELLGIRHSSFDARCVGTEALII